MSTAATPSTRKQWVATRNACKLCAPLGACLALRGIAGAVPFLHGSQGCATYMRRYLISHFREPMDIAASNFSEASTIFGGGENLRVGLKNVASQYHPELIGIATTCLTETIGEDVPLMLREIAATNGLGGPEVVSMSTPSYTGTHADGFRLALRAVVDKLATNQCLRNQLNILPGMVSPADIRYLKEIFRDLELPITLLPDYSDTLDGPATAEYRKIPEGGATLEEIRSMGGSLVTLEFGRTLPPGATAGSVLEKRFGVECFRLGVPIGVRETDRFFDRVNDVSGSPLPRAHELERGRLVDSLVDAHKYVFGKRAVVYGEEDLVVGIASFLSEIGVEPVLCASGGESGLLVKAVNEVTEGAVDAGNVRVCQGADFMEMAEEVADLRPDLLIGSSKGYSLARQLKVPLVRVGFPIHDRIGGQRILHLGYRGAQQLFDRIVNALLESKQSASPVGYSYM